jgi:hypothetical protein
LDGRPVRYNWNKRRNQISPEEVKVTVEMPSVELVQELLDLRFKYDRELQATHSRLVALEVAGEVVPQDELVGRVQTQCNQYFARILAARLVRSGEDCELLNAQDLDSLVPEIIAQLSLELSEKEDALLQRTIRTIVNSLAAAQQITHLGPGQQSFSLRKWLETVLRVAQSAGLTPQEVVHAQEYRDAVTREMMTRDEYERHVQHGLQFWLDPRSVFETFLRPVLMLMREVDNQEAISYEQMQETCMPTLTEILGKARPVVTKLVAQEVSRIYDVH